MNPKLVRWARQRVGWDFTRKVTQRFPRLRDWEGGAVEPTLRQLEKFASATHVPIGYFFLQEPPDEVVPIPDLRTIGNRPMKHPSPDLLDTIYICQQRQDWYRDHLRSQGSEPIAFVGSVNLGSDIQAVATTIRQVVGFDIEERRQIPNWTEALRRFISKVDAIGVLVMVNGVVGNNTHRKLDPDEFRGFALSDSLSPLVFINGADTKAAQMFTLAHELAHIWLGESALSDTEIAPTSESPIEIWCNEVAAEMLVPLMVLRESYVHGEDLTTALDRLARDFKVSTLVVLRRIYDAGGLKWHELREAYDGELARLMRFARKGTGGDFYLTETSRVGKRFARSLVTSTLEGHTLYRDAFRLLGISKTATLHELAQKLGVG